MSAAYDAQAIAAIPSNIAKRAQRMRSTPELTVTAVRPPGKRAPKMKSSSVPVEPAFRPRVSLLAILAPEHQPRIGAISGPGGKQCCRR